MHNAVVAMVSGNPDMNYVQVQRILGANMFTAVEMSCQEGAWFLLKQYMWEKCRDVNYVPTCPPQETSRERKTWEPIVAENLYVSSTALGMRIVLQRYHIFVFQPSFVKKEIYFTGCT
ncbi:hypothetical protein HPB48_016403 [Haemaphysalis longicornis]|uniref:Uncharacterized protein n=1 Tax=Haemaphysalis longicornis TaxID=44386 RepID=A0A9J6G8I2_HAELO|nr:hypothetical protein HPB48_016403 [Haemaphysalis longicornis]